MCVQTHRRSDKVMSLEGEHFHLASFSLRSIQIVDTVCHDNPRNSGIHFIKYIANKQSLELSIKNTI